MSENALIARREVHNTLTICNFCTTKIAISFVNDMPTTIRGKLKMKLHFMICVMSLIGLIAGEFVFFSSLLIGSSSVAAFVASLHIVGYGCMSLCKYLMMWFKRPVFRQVVNDLVELWPVNIKDEEAANVKQRSLNSLRFGQLCYMFWNIIGVCFYNLTPVILYFYGLRRGMASDLGYVWQVNYPFDKTKPVIHETVYIFEVFSGLVSVCGQIGCDLLFTTMASHISMLLRLLHVRIRNLGNQNNVGGSTKPNEYQWTPNPEYNQSIDCYEEIVSVIKVHQRLISYSKDLEDVFAMVNLINVLLSSVNICCVVFNIALLEPWLDVSSKTYLGATLTQVGMLCWYAEEIFQASLGVADAVYESGWYKINARCRRAMLLLLQRSQKPLYFTALKFRKITMTTYTTILTTSYSYFTLLYTMYRGDK